MHKKYEKICEIEKKAVPLRAFFRSKDQLMVIYPVGSKQKTIKTN